MHTKYIHHFLSFFFTQNPSMRGNIMKETKRERERENSPRLQQTSETNHKLNP